MSESLIHGEKCKIARKDVKQVLVCSAFIVWNECVYLVKGAAGDRRPLRAVYISNTQLLLLGLFAEKKIIKDESSTVGTMNNEHEQ